MSFVLIFYIFFCSNKKLAYPLVRLCMCPHREKRYCRTLIRDYMVEFVYFQWNYLLQMYLYGVLFDCYIDRRVRFVVIANFAQSFHFAVDMIAF